MDATDVDPGHRLISGRSKFIDVSDHLLVAASPRIIEERTMNGIRAFFADVNERSWRKAGFLGPLLDESHDTELVRRF